MVNLAAKALGVEADRLRKLAEADKAGRVVVTRCKDCKHRTEAGNCGHPRYHWILPSAYPYDFCSYGEWREE